jgi:hypothetical protein
MNMQFNPKAIIFALLLIPFTTRVSAQQLSANNPTEKKVLMLVSELPEVQARAKAVKKLSHNKTDIVLSISAQPDIYLPFYQVNVDDGPPGYANYYQFAVDPKSYQIFFYDAATNRQYSLTEWRKRKKKNNTP